MEPGKAIPQRRLAHHGDFSLQQAGQVVVVEMVLVVQETLQQLFQVKATLVAQEPGQALRITQVPGAEVPAQLVLMPLGLLVAMGDPALLA